MGSHWAAGHFGHVPVAAGRRVLLCDCGRIGHLEAIGSGAGMLRWYHANGGDLTVQHRTPPRSPEPTDGARRPGHRPRRVRAGDGSGRPG